MLCVTCIGVSSQVDRSLEHTLLPTRLLKQMHVKYTILRKIASLRMKPRGSKLVVENIN